MGQRDGRIRNTSFRGERSHHTLQKIQPSEIGPEGWNVHFRPSNHMNPVSVLVCL